MGCLLRDVFGQRFVLVVFFIVVVRSRYVGRIHPYDCSVTIQRTDQHYPDYQGVLLEIVEVIYE